MIIIKTQTHTHTHTHKFEEEIKEQHRKECRASSWHERGDEDGYGDFVWEEFHGIRDAASTQAMAYENHLKERHIGFFVHKTNFVGVTKHHHHR